jgi:hypothetical protein
MLSTVVATVRTQPRVRWGIAAALLVLVGAVALIAYPYGDTSGPPPTAPLRSSVLREPFIEPASDFVADPLLTSRTTPLVALTPAAGGMTDVRVLAGRRVVAQRRLPLPAGGTAALARWHGSEVAIARVQVHGGTVAVTAVSLDTGRRLIQTRAPVTPPRGAHVDADLGTWSGTTSDLFVLVWPRPSDLTAADRATGVAPAVRLDVLDGDTGFRRRELSMRLPQVIADPADWSMQIARLSGAASDLVLVRRRGSEHPEVHILSGESGFQQFILHEQFDVPASVARRASLVVANEGGRPVLRVIDPGAGSARVRVLPLGSAPAGA